MLKALVVTDQYAICDKCGEGARLPDDPIVGIGSPLMGFVQLHKKCLDVVVVMVNEMCDNWMKFKK